MAAGRGERLWPLTENRPKPLLPVGGVPVLERTLRSLSEAGVPDVVLIVNFLREIIEGKFGEGKKVGCKITYVKQNRIRGTADALNAAKGQLEGEDNFLAAYGDDYYDNGVLTRFVKRARNSDDQMMAFANVKDSSAFGNLSIEKGLVRSVREKPDGSRPGPVNAGIYFLNRSVFPAIEVTRPSTRGELELTDSVEFLIRRGEKVRSFPLKDGEWTGLSYPWDLLDANAHAIEARRSSIEGKVEKGTVIRGTATISEGAVVKSGSYLDGPVLVGKGAVVGPNSYLRPHTTIGQDAKVGASCEVKNSIVMDNARIPHLSYIGDSIISENCSLGAGTITANLRFDENPVKTLVKGKLIDSKKRKLGAILGDHVRTGINVSFLPGVKVGAGAWIGPGVVVRNDVPSGARVKA